MVSLYTRKTFLDQGDKKKFVDFIFRELITGKSTGIDTCPLLSEIFTRTRLLYLTDKDKARNYLYRKMISDKTTAYHLVYHYLEPYREYKQKLEDKKVVLELPAGKLCIQFFEKPDFDFSKLPLYIIKSNRKNNTVFLEILGSGKESWSTSIRSYSSEVSVKYDYFTTGESFFLVLDYNVRRYHEYGGCKSYSDYHKHYLLIFRFSDHRYIFFRARNTKDIDYSSNKEKPVENIPLLLKAISNSYITNITDRKEVKQFLKETGKFIQEHIQKNSEP